VAEASGLSYPYLSEIENGKKRPSSRALEGIAEALGADGVRGVAHAGDIRIGRDGGERAAPERRSWFRGTSEALMSMSSDRSRRDDVGAELMALVDRLAPEDVFRLLELARRLAR
jgi:transcriptional regulator with XRE-family HTH domain